MTAYRYSADDDVSVDFGQLRTLLEGDSVIVTRDATLTATGDSAAIFRLSGYNRIAIYGHLIAGSTAIGSVPGETNAGHNVITIGSTGIVHGEFAIAALGGDDNAIYNSGEISGGIVMNGNRGYLSNAGLVHGGILTLDGQDARILNQGEIVGGLTVYTRGSNEIVNAGAIIGFRTAILFDQSGESGNMLTNSGTIAAGQGGYAVDGSNYIDQIVNRGFISGRIALDGGDDQYSGNYGIVAGRVSGGDGADGLAGGDASSNRLDGDAGDDTLSGGSLRDWLGGGTGNDVLDGDSGNDILTGGAGSDVLRGGEGGDRFVFQSIRDSAPGAADRIEDFDARDILDLSAIDPSRAVGDQAFHLGITTGHAGDIAIRYDATRNLTYVELFKDNDALADAIIILVGQHDALTDANFRF